MTVDISRQLTKQPFKPFDLSGRLALKLNRVYQIDIGASIPARQIKAAIAINETADKTRVRKRLSRNDVHMKAYRNTGVSRKSASIILTESRVHDSPHRRNAAVLQGTQYTERATLRQAKIIAANN